MNKKLRQWYFARRGLILLPFLSVLVLCFWHEYENKWVTWPIGLSVMALGSLLRLWAIRYIGRSARTRKEKAKVLLSAGPYALIRNPLYVANIIISLGSCLLFELVWYLTILFLVLVFHYNLVVYAEESFLAEKYGAEYLRYKESVPRWIPARLSGVGQPVLSWYEALKSERHGVFTMLGIILVALAKDIIGKRV